MAADTLEKALAAEVDVRVRAALNEKMEVLRKALRGLEGVLTGAEVKAATAAKPTPRPRNSKRACSIVGCKRPVKSRGFCAAHYQKWHKLSGTGKLPAEWKPDAAPHSIKDVKLPRGRAGNARNQEAAAF